MYKRYILDGKTIIASPHKIYGPETNDLALQLRKANASQVIFARMAANLCIELDEACSSTAAGAAMTAKQPQIFAKPDHFIACKNFRASANKA